MCDVLVLGEHPAAYLAAAVLRHKGKLRIVHATLPHEATADRLTIVNPRFFDLHKLLEPLRRKLALTTLYGLRFLADQPAVHSTYRGRSTVALVGDYSEIRDALRKLAKDADVELVTPRTLEIHRVDEQGMEVTLGRTALRPRALIVAGPLNDSQRRMLGVFDSWGPGILHRYSFVRCAAGRAVTETRPLLTMSLDLDGGLYWAWMLCHNGQTQLMVEQPLETEGAPPPASELLRHWAMVLHSHGLLKDANISLRGMQSLDLPLAGALAQEGVANRTLLIGPAGGFYTACAEDIYPNCWSALYAADVMSRALKEKHLQDALQPYRHKWRTTLGDYLRGPQQNLRFLLPLVYRNQAMTDRLAEAILAGKSVIR